MNNIMNKIIASYQAKVFAQLFKKVKTIFIILMLIKNNNNNLNNHYRLFCNKNIT